jgi:cytidyltransferase-like protein
MEFLEDLHKVIKKYTTLPFDNYLLQMNAEYRYYHNLSHVEYLFNLINKLYAEDPEINRLKYLAAIHDYYYNPKLMNGENEKKSAELSKSIYYKFNKYPHDILYDAIIDTATHKNYSSELSRKFGELDMHILKSEFIGDLIQYEEKIMKEFQFCDYSLYKEGRLKFLHSLDQNDYESIHQLIDYVDNKQIDLGIYPGSFYPLHNGHEYVLDQTKHLFDKTILAFGKNPNKAFDREKAKKYTNYPNW